MIGQLHCNNSAVIGQLHCNNSAVGTTEVSVKYSVSYKTFEVPVF